jgi:peptidylprolyl isomerase
MEKRDKKIRFLMAVVLVACSVMVCLSGCTGQQPEAKAGDRVKVYYSVSFPGGEAFESNRNGSPLEYTVGSGSVVKGFDNAVMGMKPGETKTVTVPPEDAYGPYEQSLVNTLDKESVRNSLAELNQSGNLVPVNFPDGPVYIWMTEENKTGYLRFFNSTTPDTVIVDENHPLAGKDLVFTITLVEIVSSPS